jgi:hypothetical protein
VSYFTLLVTYTVQGKYTICIEQELIRKRSLVAIPSIEVFTFVNNSDLE